MSTRSLARWITISCMRKIILFLGAWLSATSALAAERAYSLVALAPDNTLVLFTSDSPGATRVVKLSGVSSTLLGIDVRPADLRLWGITASGQLVTIELPSGVATVASTVATPVGATSTSGFDFNPQADRLRLIGTDGSNLRVSVGVGAVATDGKLAYAPGDRAAGKLPRVTAVAYTNSFANAPTTITFDLDTEADTLVRQEPPNDGILHTVGPLGVDCGDATGFDIVSPSPGTDDAFVVCGRTLYRADLTSGRLTVIGEVQADVPHLFSLAVLPPGTR